MPKAKALKCFFGCNIDGPLHRFPKWEYPHTEKFEQWKSVLDSATQERGNDYIYNSIRICHQHFENCFKLPSRQLTRNATPTLNLTLSQNVQIIQAEQLPEMKQSTLSLSQLGTGSIALSSASPQTAQIVQPSTEQFTVMRPSTSGSLEFEVEPELRALSIDPKKCCLKEGSSHHINRLKIKLNKLRQKCKIQQKKILAAKKCAMSKSFLKTIENLPVTVQTFMKLQLKWRKKPKARRYNMKEKIMALSILKESPKAYEIIEKMFVLPSKRILQKHASEFDSQLDQALTKTYSTYPKR